MQKLKIVYAGSPLASAIVLKSLISSQDECNFSIVGVLTNPPSIRGRHSDLIPTEVAALARANNIPVFEFDHLLAESREAIAPLGADLLVSFDYGRIFGEKFLALFPLGGINLHPSLLPKYRGCTPVPAAILNGDKTLGITVQCLALQMDEGDILAQEEIPLDGTETTLSLMDGDGQTSPVTEAGARLLKKVLKEAANSDSELLGKKQSGETSYTPFLKKEDGIIDWNKPADEIERKIRAYTPYPLCFTALGGVKLSILKAKKSDAKTAEKPGTVLPYQKSVGIEIACGDGSILVATELQWEKKKAMDYKSFINGARNFVGSVLE
ncbi:methionyl-tRNA formyltransferase [uncultured Treponema sp.]|uniref:methionyl-tRNA formyltransferase n=1 Tax=uncultured Treponema sp. TaxID=162155 RepID=UPI0025EDB53D|nr:methionyl-tRNA formyltransferase [uncultured Treponema sp.]